MDHAYWQRQTTDQPLFPDLLWSRPETKATAGKLAIIGGNAHAFAAVAEAYNRASQAGIGVARVLLPDSLQKTVGKLFPEAAFAPSSPSGSFAQAALAQWLDLSLWADGVLLAGDFGRNSETAILIEQYLNKFRGPLTLTGDSLDYFTQQSTAILNRSDTLLAPSFNQLQKLMSAGHLPFSLNSSHQFVQHLDTLYQLVYQYDIYVILPIGQQVAVAAEEQISTTPKDHAQPLSLAASASVWWLQNPGNSFQAITTSVVT